MAPKKAAKKIAKKAAKKSSHQGDSRKESKDLRRSYEHLGRVQVLNRSLDADAASPVHLLVNHAEVALQVGDARQAADLLRAAEHLGFGALASAAEPESSLSPDLLAAVQDEYEHLREKAADHGEAQEAPKPVRAIYRHMVKGAAAAFKTKRFRAALELARGAEALTHIESDELSQLPAGGASGRLLK